MKVFALVLLAGFAYSAKLDNTYLPPGSAKTAGGGQFLSTPFNTPSQPSSQYGSPIIQARRPTFQPSFNAPVTSYGTPSHQTHSAPSYQSNFQSSSLSRPQSYSAPSPVYGPASGSHSAPSPIYGSASGPHSAPSPVYGPANGNFQRSNNPEARANTIRADNSNDGSGNYHFEYETENKISQNEQGQLKQVTEGEATVVQGSYSYAGDDGKVYTVNYIADENGFQPVGEHIDQAISMTASDAAKSAVNEGSQGYNYNGQKSYQGYSGQQGLNGYQGGFNTKQSGFGNQGFQTQGSNGFNGHQTANNGGYRY